MQKKSAYVVLKLEKWDAWLGLLVCPKQHPDSLTEGARVSHLGSLIQLTPIALLFPLFHLLMRYALVIGKRHKISCYFKA
jgi:hypothetical protein